MSIGKVDSVGCLGCEHLMVDELVTMIQMGGNAKTLLELAQLTRYPEMGKLRHAMHTVHYSLTNGCSIIIIQWLGFLLCGLAYWLVSTGVPLAWQQFWCILSTLARRLRGRPPIHGTARPNTGLDYHMTDLAQHRIMFQHVPWARYALYFMLMDMVGCQLSARSWSMDKSHAGTDTQGNEPNENSPIFDHAMLRECRFIMCMVTDECLVAQLLYSNALHSLHVLLLSESVAYVPPYLITSSFCVVRQKLAKTMLVATHSNLDAIYHVLFDEGGDMLPSAQMLHTNTIRFWARQGQRAYVHMAYNLLLKQVQSPLGQQITSSCEVYMLLNLTLLPLHLPLSLSTDGSLHSSASELASSRETLPLSDIEGMLIPAELLEKLILGCNATGAYIRSLLELFQLPDIYWGSTLWLLHMLLRAYGDFIETDLTAEDREKGESTFMVIHTELKLLCFLPFQPQYGVPGTFILDYPINTCHALHVPLGSWDVLDDAQYCNSVPAWCMCVGYYSELCTLIVGELAMHILMTWYFYMPYAFCMSFL
ncbi:hypothetical protein FBU31_005656 [Coemansia sp. 'formosensis']|nr:hypothetical protein FBU31_005656 [Coemansia sp. 'formosensis']